MTHTAQGREQSLGIAFLGCGAVARAHTRTLRSLDSTLRLYYASRDLIRASEANAQLRGAGAFGSYAAALDELSATSTCSCCPAPMPPWRSR
jgi:predicted dehydrogenase